MGATWQIVKACAFVTRWLIFGPPGYEKAVEASRRRNAKFLFFACDWAGETFLIAAPDWPAAAVVARRTILPLLSDLDPTDCGPAREGVLPECLDEPELRPADDEDLEAAGVYGE